MHVLVQNFKVWFLLACCQYIENTIDFCVNLVSYWSHLFVLGSFLCRQSCYLQIETCVFSFFFLAMVRTCSTMLNSSGKSGHTFIVPDLRRKALSFKIKYDAGCRFLFFVELLYETEDSIFSVLMSFCFYHKWVLNFVKCPLFSEFWFHMVDYIDWVSNIEPALQIWSQSLIKWVEK